MQVSSRLMALPLSNIARKVAVAIVAVMGVSTIMWSVAQSQVSPDPTGSSLSMGGQIVAPTTSPTLNSTFSISPEDEVKWITYLQSRMGSPFEATGESIFLEANAPSTNFKWVKDKLVLPPKVSFEWFVNGSGWTATEPATGTIVTKVKWKVEPMVKVDFGIVSNTVDFSGTGDGFRIIPYGKNLYVLNHHTNSRYFNCRVAATGATCAGFPANGTGLGLARFEGTAATAGDTTYYMVHNPMEAINYDTGELFVAGQRGNELDVVCVNLNTLTSCGSLNLGTYVNPFTWGGNHAPLEQLGDRYFVLAVNGDLHCVNIRTKVSCGVTNYNIAGTSNAVVGGQTISSKFGPKGDTLNKMFFAISGKVYCHDAATGAACAGWSNAGNASEFGGVMPILNNDAAGTPLGVCDGFGTNCYTIAGVSFQTSAAAQDFFMNNSFAPRTFWGGGRYGIRDAYHYSWNAGAVSGTRIITGQSNGHGVSCFDFQTNAICPGYPRRTDLLTKGYSTNMDPTRTNCVLHLGDAAQALMFDLTTGNNCQDGSEAEKPKLMDVEPAQYYRCDATQATVTAWDKVRISPTIAWGGSGGLKSVKVTLQDANGAELPPLYKPVRYFAENTYELNIGLNPTTGLPDADTVPYAQYPRLRVIVQMSGNGGLTTTKELGMDVTWKGDPIQLCYQTKAPRDPGCPTTVDTTVNLARFENPDNVFDETPSGSKSLWPGVPNTGYAAVSSATSPRSILGDAVAGKDGRTRILQGRYDMQNFTGDLWAYDLDASGNLDVTSKQSAESTLSPSLGRPVFSAQPGSGRAGSMVPYKLRLASASSAQQAALNTNAQGILDSRGNDRVNYYFGYDGPFRARTNKLGPVVSSGPIVLNRNNMPALPENLFKDYNKYRTASINKRHTPLALWGGNDGALHAFTFESGQLKEAWTFVSDVMLKRTNRLTDSSLAQSIADPYSVDAIPMYGHVDLNGSAADGWTPVAVSTYGRGARAITALDIGNADLSKGSGVLFEYTNSTQGDTSRSEGVNDLIDLGHIISQPAFDESQGSHMIVRVKDGSDQRWAVLVGNGVDSQKADDGSPSGTGRPVLYAFYLDEPRANAPRWRRIDVQSVAGITNEAGLITNNGLSNPRLVDTDGNGVVDLAYAGDLQGNLWRFDLSNMADASTKDSGRVTRLFETIDKQPIYTVPVAVRNTSIGACTASQLRQCWQVTFGSGHYFSPILMNLKPNLPTQYLYGLLDKGDKTAIDIGNLELNAFEVPALRPATNIDFRTVSARKIDYAAGKRGWYMALGTNEHLVGAVKLQPTGLAMYPVVSPGKKSSSTASCAPAQSWLVELNPMTGAPAGYTFDINGDGRIDSADVFPSGGKIPAAMAISGNQFGPPAILLDSSNSSNTMSLVLPSAGQDKSAPQSYGTGSGAGGAGGNPKHGNPKQLGRMSWREVY